MIKRKSKGGNGKAETLRNKAVIILNKIDSKTFNTNTLGILFERDRKTISGIIENYSHKFGVGVIPS